MNTTLYLHQAFIIFILICTIIPRAVSKPTYSNTELPATTNSPKVPEILKSTHGNPYSQVFDDNEGSASPDNNDDNDDDDDDDEGSGSGYLTSNISGDDVTNKFDVRDDEGEDNHVVPMMVREGEAVEQEFQKDVINFFIANNIPVERRRSNYKFIKRRQKRGKDY